MLGRKAALAAVLAGAAAFSGGVALAATHGPHHAAPSKTPLHRSVVVQRTAPNVHYPCRHDDGNASRTASL